MRASEHGNGLSNVWGRRSEYQCHQAGEGWSCRVSRVCAYVTMQCQR